MRGSVEASCRVVTIVFSRAASCVEPRLRPHVLLCSAVMSEAGGAQQEGVPSLHPHSTRGGEVSTHPASCARSATLRTFCSPS